jgi:hypothetical protein
VISKLSARWPARNIATFLEGETIGRAQNERSAREPSADGQVNHTFVKAGYSGWKLRSLVVIAWCRRRSRSAGAPPFRRSISRSVDLLPERNRVRGAAKNDGNQPSASCNSHFA